jgi:hypothetical protein
MSHLTSESLARLVDESPTTAEQTHLDACDHCREALDAMRMQTIALGALPPLMPPADAWDRIVARIESDRVVPVERRWTAGTATRAAAAIVLFALGAAAGAIVSRQESPSATAIAEPGGVAGSPEFGTSAVLTATTPEVALARLRIAEAMYTDALLDYAAITSPEPPKDAVARLATLETIVLTTRTALQRAPGDPLINSYHLAALAERQTLLGQLRRTSETKQWY